MVCIICNGPERECDLRLYDDRYGYPGVFSLLECAACGHRRLNVAFSTEQLKDMYTRYYPRSMYDPEKHKPHREKSRLRNCVNAEYCYAYRWVPRNVRVLDIGCGYAETLGYHRSRGCDAYGVEVDENVRKVAELYGYKIHMGLFDPKLYEPGSFDYVTMDQVIEHFADPVAELQGVARILKTGGKAILCTPNSNGWGRKLYGRRWVHWHAPYHLQHFSARSMTMAAGKAGLIVETARTITPPMWLHFQRNHLLANPKMGHPSRYWVPFERKDRTSKAMAAGTLLLFHCTGINHLIARITDYLGAGDNYHFVLKKA